ncbi:MAG: DUF368 domain-containing protein [Christensenella sp.]|uniref:DUF368 domain-containing protein n=1 Tax=Christensenella sp. TaxID=1935934 RepID=UPI002B2021B1|nr:DUF368 domain-containing protein [Christensenella sp.]MEA5002549.1 DUF368 domain-containing protein [Christensenella sp.]
MDKREKKGNRLFAWIFRLVKGIVIGTGFIIPGVSGGVFAAIFGVYEPMIRFFANLRKNFMQNLRFFLPIGIGVLISMVLVSKVLGEFFQVAEVPLVWFFIGCVAGTFPALYKQAGRQGRKPVHFVVLAVTAAAMIFFLLFMQKALGSASLPTNNVFVWLMAGALMGLGAIVPGLSPSNFLLYMGIYGVMMTRIGSMDLSVLIPVVAGAVLCFLLLSKAFSKLFDKAYSGMYHFILGVIIASTIMIVPWSGKALENGGTVAYSPALVLICIGATVGGIALGYVMGRLEKKYKPDETLTPDESLN